MTATQRARLKRLPLVVATVVAITVIPWRVNWPAYLVVLGAYVGTALALATADSLLERHRELVEERELCRTIAILDTPIRTQQPRKGTAA